VSTAVSLLCSHLLCLVFSLFRKTFTVALWFSKCGQNEELPNVFQAITFPVMVLVKNVLSYCLQDVMSFLTCEFLLDTLTETDEPAAIK